MAKPFTQIIAIASGKGGVGKTTTTANIALSYAHMGLSTLILDVDPLSDIPSILDFPPLSELKGRSLEDIKHPLFPSLDLIVPHKCTAFSSALEVVEHCFSVLGIQDIYDRILFDMPAGIDYDSNLAFLKWVDKLVLVTNPEPTSHVSAGGYIKEVLSHYPHQHFYFWHNKYTPSREDGFDSRDIIGNYNKNMPEEQRLEAEDISSSHLAFIKSDPTMDLLKGNPSIKLNLQRDILDILNTIIEILMPGQGENSVFKGASFALIRSYIVRHPEIADVEDYLGDLGRFLILFMGGAVTGEQNFSFEQETEIKAYLLRVKGDPVRKEVLNAVRLLEEKISVLENAASPFGFKGVSDGFKMIDRELLKILMIINEDLEVSPLLINFGSLLLFYFSLLKLFQSETIYSLIMDFIPRKREGKQMVRDRYEQISCLVAGNKEYRSRYLELIKVLHPVVSRQVEQVVEAFGFQKLLFKDREGHTHREAYVKLFTTFLHDTLYSGLGVTVGFKYRPASVAFKEAVDALDSISSEHKAKAAI